MPDDENKPTNTKLPNIVADIKADVLTEVRGELIAERPGLVGRVFALPPWAVVTIILAGMVSIVANRYIRQDAAPPVPVEIKVTTPAAAPEELVAQGVAGQRLGPARRLFVDAMKRRLTQRLQKDGFALVGGDPTPLTPAQAETLIAERLNDQIILQGAIESGGIGDGKILDRLSALVDWIIAHQDQILKIIQFLMTLLAFI